MDNLCLNVAQLAIKAVAHLLAELHPLDGPCIIPSLQGQLANLGTELYLLSS